MENDFQLRKIPFDSRNFDLPCGVAGDLFKAISIKQTASLLNTVLGYFIYFTRTIPNMSKRSQLNF